MTSIKKISQSFYKKALKLPLDSAPRGGFSSKPEEALFEERVDNNSKIEHDSFPDLDKKEKPKSGYMVQAINQLDNELKSFVAVNDMIFRGPAKQVYINWFKQLKSAIDTVKPILPKNKLNKEDLQNLDYVSRVFFFIFEKLNGSGFEILYGFKPLMISLIRLGSVMWREAYKQTAELYGTYPLGNDPWKKFDPSE